MLLGPVLCCCGSALISYSGYGFVKEHSSKSKIRKEFEDVFYKLGILDKSKNEKATYVSFTGNPNYIKMFFKLTKNITTKNFESKEKELKEKLNLKNLEIGYENKKMYFKVRYDDRDILWYKDLKSPLYTLVPLGLDEDGKVIFGDLTVDAHWLIAGATNCGKSTLLRNIIFYFVSTDKYQLILIDLKKGIEFNRFRKLKNVIGYAEEIDKGMEHIEWFGAEYQRRIKIIRDSGYNEFSDYEEDHPGEMKRVVMIIDEFADFVPRKPQKNEITPIDRLVDLARKCRAAGMHLIIATQRPSRDVVEGSLKSNFTGIIGLRTTNETNSRIIIDEPGLEELAIGESIALLKGRKTFFYVMLLKGKELRSMIEKYNAPKEEHIDLSESLHEQEELTEEDVDKIVDNMTAN